MAIPFIGIAFGFFIGCSALKPANKSNTDETLSESDLKRRLDTIEEQISEHPDNAEAHYQKGEVLSKLARRKNPPDSRTNLYQQMQHSLAEAGSVYQTEGNSQGEEKVDELLKVSWSFEHNQGVEILQSDSTLENEDFSRAASHFNNAIVIIPDSTVSYKMKARALYRNHKADKAIQTLETARKRIDDLPTSFLEQLAFLYLEQDQAQKAINLYEEAEAFSDDNLNLLHGLANAYITANQHRQAVELLGTLVENEPENVIYLESYGTELYSFGIQQYDSLATSKSTDSVAIQQAKFNADTLLELAEDQFKKILHQNPDATGVKQKLADLYKNYAVKLVQVKPLFSSFMQQKIEEKVEANLSNAVNLYEELVKQQPDQSEEYWKSLYQAYSYLGMQQKAEEAKAKANI